MYTVKVTSDKHSLSSYEFTHLMHHSSLQRLVLALFSASGVTSPKIEALIPEMSMELPLPFIWSTSFEVGSLLRDMNLLTGMLICKHTN